MIYESLYIDVDMIVHPAAFISAPGESKLYKIYKGYLILFFSSADVAIGMHN